MKKRKRIQKRKMCIKCELVRPSFGLKTDKRPSHCASCKDDDMVDIVNKKCICGISIPNFGLKGDKVAKYCFKCKTDDMVDIVSKKCICGKTQPNFGLKGDKVAKYCFKCKSPEMIDLKHKRCICGKTRPCFGFENDKQPTCCVSCKIYNMIDITNPKCINECGIRVYKLDPNREYCHMCYCKKSNMIPKRRKVKEQWFEKLISKEFPGVFTYNKSIPTNCRQIRFPDWSKDFISHVLILECDEHQHKHGKYKDCETRRTCEIYDNAARRPVVFIRFNPDKYIDVNGVLHKGCFKTYIDNDFVPQRRVCRIEIDRRWDIIKTQIKKFLDNPTKVPNRAITRIKLFYDGF